MFVASENIFNKSIGKIGWLCLRGKNFILIFKIIYKITIILIFNLPIKAQITILIFRNYQNYLPMFIVLSIIIKLHAWIKHWTNWWTFVTYICTVAFLAFLSNQIFHFIKTIVLLQTFYGVVLESIRVEAKNESERRSLKNKTKSYLK